MRRLCILASILFATAASVSAQTTAQSRTAPQIVNETVKAARSSLDAGNNASRLSQTDAERMIEACSGLAGLDVTEHELRCSNNPAVAWSFNYLKLPTTKLSARTRNIVLNYARSDRSRAWRIRSLGGFKLPGRLRWPLSREPELLQEPSYVRREQALPDLRIG
jgi:hypothetical protein